MGGATPEASPQQRMGQHWLRHGKRYTGSALSEFSHSNKPRDVVVGQGAQYQVSMRRRPMGANIAVLTGSLAEAGGEHGAGGGMLCSWIHRETHKRT